MGTATLEINGPEGLQRLNLEAGGILIGRSQDCDLILDGGNISRQHARLYKDPFSRWIIEDMGSRNGIWIGGKKVSESVVAPGQKVDIGNYSMAISEAGRSSSPKFSGKDLLATVTVIDDYEQTHLSQEAAEQEVLPRYRLEQLTDLIEQLGNVPSVSELYPTLCRQTAMTSDGIVTVLRVPADGRVDSVEILASNQVLSDAANRDDNINLSRRVLEAACSKKTTVMAGNVKFADTQMNLTVFDESRPRVVICSPVRNADSGLELLYVDLLCDQAGENIFDYIQAVARQAGFAYKSLQLSEMREEQRVLDSQLGLAREIQQSLMPKDIETFPSLDVAIFYEPAMWVGGDYCDIWTIPDGRTAFVVGDVSGKGLPAAMVMMSIHSTLRASWQFCDNISDVMGNLCRHLREHIPEGLFVTLFLGVFDSKSGKLAYSNAGHLLPVIFSKNKPTAFLGEPANPPLGIVEHAYTSESTYLEPNDGIVLVTDGITESKSHGDEEFGSERLCQTTDSNRSQTCSVLVNEIASAARAFHQPLAQPDDITVLAIAHKGN